MPHRALIRTAVALAALATTAAPASATTLKTVAGATLASNTAIAGVVKSGTNVHLEGGSAGDIDCSSASLGGTIGTNPNTPSVTGAITSLTFTGCTDSIPFVTISCLLTDVGTGPNAKTLTFTYTGGTSTMAVATVELTACFSNGSTCVYETLGPFTATHNSLSTPLNNEYSFAATPLSKTGGTFFGCPANPTYTATFRLVRASDGAAITIQP